MKPFFLYFFALSWVLTGMPSSAQDVYLTEKQGIYVYKNNLEWKGADYVAFGKNVKHLTDYLQQSVPLLKANKGFDLEVILFGTGSDDYLNMEWNYGFRGELNFFCQLFFKDATGKEGIWTNEPPGWELNINNTETGHGGMINECKECPFLNELFLIFPLVKELAPGVRYYDCTARGCGSLVVFNPDRPDCWLPVTVREVVDAKLKYYQENDKMIYDFIKPLTEKMSEAEFNAPAFNGSDDAILNVNGIGEGLQIMRFNPEYWDRSMPPSAIQFITFLYSEYGCSCQNKEEQKMAEEEYFKNNGHINYSSEIIKTLNVHELTKAAGKDFKFVFTDCVE